MEREVKEMHLQIELYQRGRVDQRNTLENKSRKAVEVLLLKNQENLD